MQFNKVNGRRVGGQNTGEGSIMSTHKHIAKCPRCGIRALEVLKTHAHCMECLYFEDYYEDFNTTLTTALLAERLLKSAPVHKIHSKKNKKPAEAAS
ncbi:MAG: hypothetical protein A4S09_13420 [Proteobacteria bacterium SG_bin7]|nr:MAG: hypothetical protein A4S09_13420 [Proteobacteria bacterium SG_bin7]